MGWKQMGKLFQALPKKFRRLSQLLSDFPEPFSFQRVVCICEYIISLYFAFFHKEGIISQVNHFPLHLPHQRCLPGRALASKHYQTESFLPLTYSISYYIALSPQVKENKVWPMLQNSLWRHVGVIIFLFSRLSLKQATAVNEICIWSQHGRQSLVTEVVSPVSKRLTPSLHVFL